MPNKLSQFWQELKRRKVIRVITVYAAASFVILQLIEILAPSLRLPEWTMNFILVLLIVGFIIAVILSWIYDVHPDGGIVKTESAQKATEAQAPSSSKGWKIASYISFVVIVGLIVLNIIPRANNNRKVPEKSIAVLPLDYLSEDPHKEYLANAVLDAITGHLSMIEGLRVMPRTSVEQYRENKKPAKEIGEELNVSYLIEGSFLMIEDQVKLTIQLVVANEGDHVFFKEYDRNYKDILIVQSEVAKTIAKEIEIAITPEEKQRIEKVPTTSLTALDFYQRGREAIEKYFLDRGNPEALVRAEDRFFKALEYDSSFALAYTGLAQVYWHKHYWETYFSENFLDSVLILADMALSFDPQLSEAYTVRGSYYGEKGQTEKAINEFEKAIELNPNDWLAYYGIGYIYRGNHNYIKSIDNLHKAANLNRGPFLPRLLTSLAWAYAFSGFPEQYQFYQHEAFILGGDSIRYYHALTKMEDHYGNPDKHLKSLESVYFMDTTRNNVLLDLAHAYGDAGKFEESLKYLKKYFKRMEARGSFQVNNMQRLGYAYWMNGYKTEANFYFDKMIEYYNNLTDIGREMFSIYYDLAGVYAFRGEKERAYENLRKFNEKERIPLWWSQLIKNDPLFNSIRDEPEFQQIVRDVEAKYEAEHERVKQWLVENDML